MEKLRVVRLRMNPTKKRRKVVKRTKIVRRVRLVGKRLKKVAGKKSQQFLVQGVGRTGARQVNRMFYYLTPNGGWSEKRAMAKRFPGVATAAEAMRLATMSNYIQVAQVVPA